MLGEIDHYLFQRGTHWRLHELLGSHIKDKFGSKYTQFAVWAPQASNVSVIGEFNGWDVEKFKLKNFGGIWEGDWPFDLTNCIYKYAIEDTYGDIHYKLDPFCRLASQPPDANSIVTPLDRFDWSDDTWMDLRQDKQKRSAPMSVYEVHLGSWKKDEYGNASYIKLAEELIAYVVEMGFTHIELLPIFEYPFGGSWGYQPICLFAPTSRFGQPDDLRHLINEAHKSNIGIILDWVPGHFPDDSNGLNLFDGSPLFEYSDPKEGIHPHWDTKIYNFSDRREANFLISSAIFWAQSFHIDGFRVDAVASMLYRNYGRENGEFIANESGGIENLEAISFLKEFNQVIHQEAPNGIITIAEDSTSWPKVTHEVKDGGLGFDYKWNMGWMNDTLNYLKLDPIYRRYHHEYLTFGIMYAWKEQYFLPLSHDEVVHGKGSLFNKPPGNTWEKFSQLRMLLAWQFTMPGRKLLFMGSELGMKTEWNHDSEVDWALDALDSHRGIKNMVQDLNILYRGKSAMHAADENHELFKWVNCDDTDHSIVSFRRRSNDSSRNLTVICNFTPNDHYNFRVGMEQPGTHFEIFNSQSHYYGGSNLGNIGEKNTEAVRCDNYPWSLNLVLPGFSVLIFS